MPDLHSVKQFVALALSKTGRHSEAVPFFVSLLKVFPENVITLRNLAISLRESREYQAAADVYLTLLQLDPTTAQEVYLNLADISRRLGNRSAALDFAQKGYELNPENLDLAKNYVGLLSARGNISKAIEIAEKTLLQHPTQDDLKAFVIRELAHVCDWARLKPYENEMSQIGLGAVAVDPFSFVSLDGDPESTRQRMRKHTARALAATQMTRPPLVSPEGRKIRIGYFSSDFYAHATMDLLRGVLRNHNRDLFEVHLFYYADYVDDAEHQFAKTHSDFVHYVRDKSDLQIAQLSRELKIDVAVDLKGHTNNNRIAIFGWGAAPITISYLGYPGTLGSEVFDYMVVDAVTVPPELENHYDEKLIFMPGSYQPNDDQRMQPDWTKTRADYGLPEDAFVFCSFNSAYKITEDCFERWMEIMTRVENSVLWLLARNDLAFENLQKEAQARGIAPERLIRAHPVSRMEHLARHHLADLFIDTFTCNAHTTAADALWMGLPVITMPGQVFQSRVAASLLSALEMDELIVETQEEYVALVCKLAQSDAALKAVKEKILKNQKSAALFDTQSYTRALESAFVEAVTRHHLGKPHEHLRVDNA
ncbi:tetratricopeptide repeat protein [Shimia sp. R9_2]|uniref:O-linked N-acetylglucosamine transferase, SPINDLY family protein n=1 Tax=Shimia sp. R9_2 TaxID=2821112 RepID=UPI0032AF96B0